MIEPHWHRDTAEMGYIMEGRAHITIVSPNVNHQGDTFQLKQDDICFVPRSYPHHIENIGECSLKIVIFFDKSNCSQIGYKTGFLAFSTQVLGGALQCGAGQVPTIPGNPYHTIVPRINPKIHYRNILLFLLLLLLFYFTRKEK